MTTKAHNIDNIDLLRAIAALVVILHHLYTQLQIKFGWLSIHGGWVGVQLFYIISGYLIIHSAEKYRLREYTLLRAMRIFPAYLFWFFAFGKVGFASYQG